MAHNANFANIEIETGCRIRTKKAYSSVRDSVARWPNKNISEITSKSLVDTPEEDEFTHLIVAAPTVDISNMDVTKLTINDNVEALKQKVVVSCQNVFNVAQNAITRHPQLQKVVIMEHAPRHDVPNVDPTGIKPRLAKLANLTFVQLWQSSNMKDNILIGKHSLDCTRTGDQLAARYMDDRNGRYDGVHMYGSHGKHVYTKSVLDIMKAILPQSSTPSSSLHSSCPQTKYQQKQTKNMSSQAKHQNKNIYTIPVNNQFDILGN